VEAKGDYRGGRSAVALAVIRRQIWVETIIQDDLLVVMGACGLRHMARK